MYSSEYFDFQLDRMGTNTYKWDWARETYGKDILPLFVADMDFRSAAEISQMLVSRAQHNTFGYTRSSEKEYQAVIDFVSRHHGQSLKKEDIVLMPSVVTGLKVFIRCFSEAGEGVVIQSPVYGQFFKSIESNHRTVVENPLLRDGQGRYSMDFDHLEDLFRKGKRRLIVCNPHNPVSRYWSKEELTRLLQLAMRYDVFVCSDEIHADFIYPPHTFVSLLTIAKELGYDKVLSLYAPSKTFNIAGMKLAYLFCCNKAMRERIAAEQEACGIESGNIFGLISANAAFTYGDEWLKGLIQYLDGSRRILTEELGKIDGLKLTPIEATYLAWMDLRSFGYSAKDLTERCLKQNVLFTEGSYFNHEKGEGYLRFNFGCPRANIYEGIERLKRALK